MSYFNGMGSMPDNLHIGVCPWGGNGELGRGLVRGRGCDGISCLAD